jgi:hypothetical protein
MELIDKLGGLGKMTLVVAECQTRTKNIQNKKTQEYVGMQI